MSREEHFDPRGDGFGFIVTVEDAENYMVNVSVRYITGRAYVEGSEARQLAPLDAAVDTEPYLTATLKWDGCMHFQFKHGDDGYYHWCGVRDMVLHCDLIRYLHGQAYEWMGRKPEDGEEWPA